MLRGEKARFQLFGDTVNTASRMESNGEKGRIHVSEQTAEALRAKGKGHWLTAREDMIEAKGKGTLQTYWVSEQGHAPRSSMDTSSYRGPASSSGASSSGDAASRHDDENEEDDDNVEARLVARLAKDHSGSTSNKCEL